MSAPQFVPGPHPSHDWRQFLGDGVENDRRMCTRCEICTCHSPVASTEPCDHSTPVQQCSTRGEQK